MNVGYDYSFWNAFGLQLRDRVSLAFLDDIPGHETTNTAHGPEISFGKSWYRSVSSWRWLSRCSELGV